MAGSMPQKQDLLELLLFSALELLPQVIRLLLIPAILVLVIASMALPVLLRLLTLPIILRQICPCPRILQPYFLQTAGDVQPPQNSPTFAACSLLHTARPGSNYALVILSLLLCRSGFSDMKSVFNTGYPLGHYMMYIAAGPSKAAGSPINMQMQGKPVQNTAIGKADAVGVTFRLAMFLMICGCALGTVADTKSIPSPGMLGALPAHHRASLLLLLLPLKIPVPIVEYHFPSQMVVSPSNSSLSALYCRQEQLMPVTAASMSGCMHEEFYDSCWRQWDRACSGGTSGLVGSRGAQLL